MIKTFINYFSAVNNVGKKLRRFSILKFKLLMARKYYNLKNFTNFSREDRVVNYER